MAPCPADGVAPDGFHATSNHPEYVKLPNGTWTLLTQSRMDAVIVLREATPEASACLEVVEPRRLRRGDSVVVVRSEDGSEGLLVHVDGFTSQSPENENQDKFAFRTRGSRESAFSASYEWLYDVLRHDREHGYIVWVGGPAIAFDKDSRESLGALIRHGYCHALLAGNALATHDLEAGHFGTALGQDVYNQRSHRGGHYHHLEVLNAARAAGSIAELMQRWPGDDPGIMAALEATNVPYVLAGSIRDDGPLPEVLSDAYEAQDAMRVHGRRATCVIAMATQLHSIAFGNQIPGYRVQDDGSVRPVVFVAVDTTEFVADKLANRGSAQAKAFVTNVQDFLVNLKRHLVDGDDGGSSLQRPSDAGEKDSS